MNGTSTAVEIRRLPQLSRPSRLPACSASAGSSAYQAVKAGTWPTRVLRLGRTIRIPAAGVLALLGIDTDQMQGSQS